MPRFVILEHDSPRGRHWDLLLETGSVLAAWALEKPPGAATPIDADALPDHRLVYLDHEGPIAGDRGSATQWDAGEYQLESRTDTELSAILFGHKLSGRITLVQVPEHDRWRFHWTPSETKRPDPCCDWP